MALNTKRASKTKKDGLRGDDPSVETVASTKVEAAKAKVAKAKLTKAKKAAKAKVTKAITSPVKPVRASKKSAPSLVGRSKAPVAGKKPKPPKPAQRPKPKQHKIQDQDAVQRDDAGEIVALLDPMEVAKKTLKGSVPAIVEAMVELAKQGSCSHAKTLLEMTGAKHMFDGESAAQGGSEPWAKLVLERLDEAESEAEQETVSAKMESLVIAE